MALFLHIKNRGIGYGNDKKTGFLNDHTVGGKVEYRTLILQAPIGYSKRRLI